MKNTGKEYELFVRDVQQILLNIEGRETITVEQNKVLYDRIGNPRQFDVYWEFKIGGYLYKIVIECKDYSSSISIEKIDAFVSKISDIPGLKGIFATKVGYQEGAQNKAKHHGIGLFIIRKPQNNDWTLDDGTPLVREIQIKGTLKLPCEIIQFIPIATKQPQNSHFNAMEDEIFIIENDKKTSLYDLKMNLPTGLDKIVEEEIFLENGFLEIQGEKLKIKGYRIQYQSFKDHEQPPIIINSQDYTKAYIEDHIEKTRRLLKNDGSIVHLSSEKK